VSARAATCWAALVAVTVTLVGCAHTRSSATQAAIPPGAPAPAAPPGGWKSTLREQHPLVGRIWSVADRRFIGPDDLVAALVPVRYALLGEKHDNADAHALQAWALSALVAKGRKPAAVFEQLRRDQQGVLESYQEKGATEARPLGAALDWDKSGWPGWSLYEPVFAVALTDHLPIFAGDLSKDDLTHLRKPSLDDTPVVDRQRFGLDMPPTQAQTAALVAELKASHCGYGNDSMFGRMVVVQWARDAQLAASLVDAAQKADGAVLIAGSGHARSDRGAPLHLSRFDPFGVVRSVAFLEVIEGVGDPQAYTEPGDTTLPFDFVYFTPRVDEDDPCAPMREHMMRTKT
jgi:uncharacterized iron-regulated protein